MTMKILVLLFVAVSVVSCLPRRFLFQDHCTQNPETGRTHINYPDNEPNDYDVDMTCRNGTIYWNSPFGTINLHFKDDRSFTACFRDEIGAAVLELSDVTSGAPTAFPSLFHGDDPDKDYCITSVNNRLIIKMHAPFHGYVAAFSYQLRY